MRIISFLTLVLFLASCSGNGDNKKDATGNENGLPGEQASARADMPEGCYRSVTGRDTLTLHLQRDGEAYTGRMHFDNYEKDQSQGTVQGEMENGLLHLWYSFNSEGMHSVMEVILKQEGKNLLRAIGPVTNRGDTALFKNANDIEFPAQDPLVNVDCNELKD